jgi:protein-disulfide isomerase
MVAIFGGVRLLRSGRGTQPFTTPGVPGPSAAPQDNLSGETVVTLEEFGDYQCPPCGELHPTLKKLKHELGPNLNFIFRNLPLSSIHKNALIAAQAAEAARMQGRFWEMHDLLYENQDLWKDDINPRSTFLKFAGDIGLDTQRFRRDLEDKQVQLRIDADVETAASHGIIGTPTILIEGRQLRPETTTPDGVRKGIEVMMGRKKPSSP